MDENDLPDEEIRMMWAQGTPVTISTALKGPGTIQYNPGGPIIPLTSSPTIRLIGVPVSPDLLRYEQLGEADGWRGRVVRAIFLLLKLWPPPCR